MQSNAERREAAPTRRTSLSSEHALACSKSSHLECYTHIQHSKFDQTRLARSVLGCMSVWNKKRKTSCSLHNTQIGCDPPPARVRAPQQLRCRPVQLQLQAGQGLHQSSSKHPQLHSSHLSPSLPPISLPSRTRHLHPRQKIKK